MKNWQAIFLALIVFGLGYFISYVVNISHPQWYEDALMLQKVTNDIKEPGTKVEIRKIWKDDLHGMDHKSLIVAAELVKDSKEATFPRKAILRILDKPEKDYDLRLEIAPLSKKTGELLTPWWTKIETADLDDDGKKEIIACWYDGSATGFENYVAVIGWDGRTYKFLDTIPSFDSVEGKKSQIVPAGLTINMVWEPKTAGGIGTKATLKLRNCTHMKLKDIDQDGMVEVICAHMIWPTGQSPGQPEYESHHSDHSYIIRVLELHEGKLISDYSWNKGEPLYISEKMPAYHFIFTQEIIDMGLPDKSKRSI